MDYGNMLIILQYINYTHIGHRYYKHYYAYTYIYHNLYVSKVYTICIEIFGLPFASIVMVCWRDVSIEIAEQVVELRY